MYNIEVENIKCSGCANSIEKALLKINGVENVKVNIAGSSVSFEGNPDMQHVLEVLADLGYPEKGSNTPLRKAKSYFNCALGKIT